MAQTRYVQNRGDEPVALRQLVQYTSDQISTASQVQGTIYTRTGIALLYTVRVYFPILCRGL